MKIPNKKSCMKSKYNWTKLLKTGVQQIEGDRKFCLLAKANAYYMAKRNGIKITTRLYNLGIKIYVVK